MRELLRVDFQDLTQVKPAGHGTSDRSLKLEAGSSKEKQKNVA
jgi:hypothetical protein